MVRRLLGAVLTASLALGAAGTPATADPPPGGAIVTYFYAFVPGDDTSGAPAVMAPGTELTYVNLDGLTHTVTSVERSGGSPLFDSGHVFPNTRAPIRGTAELAPGRYPFVCALHPFLMRGTLEVLPTTG